MRNITIIKSLILSICLLCSNWASATGEPSTYFNIFVPPNNDAVQRNVCLIVTAIFDSTTFTITDDAMDGDSDDSFSGVLMAGQSYILYIKDNGINDDAQYASGGVLKRDGDYFIITANKNVYASQSTNSDWQHDWVPGISQSSLSTKFILYSPKGTSSKRDINAMAYEDSTMVSLRRISLSATQQTGYTNVDYQGGTVIFQRMIHRGQDLIHFYTNARDILDNGHSYVIESNKPITLQYGALYGNERDGGGYVPTSNGSSSGSLCYFTVPYQSVGEQEIRIVSWDAGNNVRLYRYSGGNWIQMQNWTMGARSFQEWVGRNNGNVSYGTVFKVECTPGKRVSVFEGNWFETGSPGTSDMATMVSAENGTTAGTYFISYMAPPGNENNVWNPFSNAFFGGQYTHLYIFAQDSAVVTVKDAYSNGADFNRTYRIAAGRYADCALSLIEWRSIYNNTGTTAGGPERPYLIVESNSPVSVMNTNFNDNWMMYFGSSQFQSFSQKTQSSTATVIPGQQLVVTSDIEIVGSSTITNVSATVSVEGGLRVVGSDFINVTDNQVFTDSATQNGNIVQVEFENLPNLDPSKDYQIVTTLVGAVMDAEGKPIPNNSVSEVTCTVNGTAAGRPMQSIGIESVATGSYNTNNLIFDFAENTGLENLLTDSWTVSAVDYDNDNDDDLFFTDRSPTAPNRLFRNNGNGSFTQITSGSMVTDLACSIAASWADFDNDGDQDVVIANNTQKNNFFYVNNGNGSFTKNTSAGFTQTVGYYHHVSWVDVNNDGVLELFMGNYWPTKFNELWKRDSSGTWALWTDNLLSQIPGSGVGATWCDYDKDGYQDLLILNNAGGKNQLYHNLGNGNFEAISNVITNDGGNSVGSTWGDVDNDGDLDLYIANASNMPNYFYRNNGNGSFTKVTSGAFVTMNGHSHGCSFADVDRDCDLDLFVSNDQGVKFLFINDGAGNFTNKNDEWPSSDFGLGYGAAFSDIDADGDLDLISATHGNQRNYIFTANNNYNSNKWMNIRLLGTNSNKNAIGAKLRLYAGNKWQMREVNAQNGIGGQNSYRQNFGLCNATTIDTIEVRWPSGYVQRLFNVNTNQNIVIVEDTGSTVSGKLYYDANGNCQLDQGENYLTDVRMLFNNGNFSAHSNRGGEFSLKMAPGTYNVQIGDSRFQNTCGMTQSVNVNSVGARINLGDIPLTTNCQYPDLNLQASTTVMRRGFPSSYILEVTNTGVGMANSVQLNALLDLGITIDSATVAIDNMTTGANNTSLLWNLGNLNPGETRVIRLYYRVSLSVALGAQLQNSFSVSTSSNECATNNNAIVDYQTIFGSIDPNDLQAYPNGLTEQHYIEPTQDLTYRIRFQNVGNYQAEFVTLAMKIPAGLDVQQIHSLTASHAYAVQSAEGVLIVRFDNIYLPDSASDEAGSNGYFQFTIPQKEGNVGGTQFIASAEIVFDYNEPIITNQVFHTVLGKDEDHKNGSLIVFPNPTIDGAYISATLEDGTMPNLNTIEVFDGRGALVHQEKVNSQMPRIFLGQLAAGTYLIRARDDNGAWYATSLILQK